MPFVYPSQYLESADEFVAHWGQVNAALGASLLTLRGGYALATLQADRAALAAAITAVQNADNTGQNASATRDIAKNALKERLRQYKAAVQGLLGGASIVNSLPKTPQISAAPGKWIDAFDDIAGSWAQINAAPPTGFVAPLRLAGGYLLATFQADLAALKAAFTAVTNAERGAALARRQRDDLSDPMRTRLKEYRLAVAGAFPSNDALISALPALSPAPGATPNPVALAATWDAANAKAKLSWTPSSSANVSGYVVRYCPVPRYKASDEQAITSLPATATTFTTEFGLSAPGSVAYFKVYTQTAQGGEKGSNAVKVVRV